MVEKFICMSNGLTLARAHGVSLWNMTMQSAAPVDMITGVNIRVFQMQLSIERRKTAPTMINNKAYWELAAQYYWKDDYKTNHNIHTLEGY